MKRKIYIPFTIFALIVFALTWFFTLPEEQTKLWNIFGDMINFIKYMILLLLLTAMYFVYFHFYIKPQNWTWLVFLPLINMLLGATGIMVRVTMELMIGLVIPVNDYLLFTLFYLPITFYLSLMSLKDETE